MYQNEDAYALPRSTLIMLIICEEHIKLIKDNMIKYNVY